MKVKGAIAAGILGGLLILVLMSAGCATQTVPEAQAQLCEDLTALGQSLSTLENINASSSRAEFQDARAQVEQDMQAVRTSAANVQEAQIDELNAAYDDLEQALRQVPEDATLAETAGAIQPQLAALRAEWQQVFSGLNCS